MVLHVFAANQWTVSHFLYWMINNFFSHHISWKEIVFFFYMNFVYLLNPPELCISVLHFCKSYFNISFPLNKGNQQCQWEKWFLISGILMAWAIPCQDIPFIFCSMLKVVMELCMCWICVQLVRILKWLHSFLRWICS